MFHSFLFFSFMLALGVHLSSPRVVGVAIDTQFAVVAEIGVDAHVLIARVLRPGAVEQESDAVDEFQLRTGTGGDLCHDGLRAGTEVDGALRLALLVGELCGELSDRGCDVWQLHVRRQPLGKDPGSLLDVVHTDVEVLRLFLIEDGAGVVAYQVAGIVDGAEGLLEVVQVIVHGRCTGLVVVVVAAGASSECGERCGHQHQAQQTEEFVLFHDDIFLFYLEMIKKQFGIIRGYEGTGGRRYENSLHVQSSAKSLSSYLRTLVPSLLLNHDLDTIVDVYATAGGLAVQLHSMDGVPI